MHESIDADRSNPLVFLNLGKTFYICSKYNEAISAFQNSIRLNQNISETWFCLGNALRETGRNDEAIQCYYLALKLNNLHFGACLNLGVILKETGRIEESAQIMLKLIELHPKYAPAYVILHESSTTKIHKENIFQKHEKLFLATVNKYVKDFHKT